MIQQILPRRIRLIPAAAIFSATFNAPTIGKYDFAGQKQIFIPELTPNSVFLIDTITIAGDVASEDYLSAIDTTPIFSLKKTIGEENIFDMPIPIQSFSTDRQIARYFKTGLSNCGLCATITGALNQIPAFIGVGSIRLSINFAIYGIDASEYEKQYTREG